MSDDRREMEARLADYLEGRLSPEERRKFEEEVLEDDRLARELYAEINLEEGLRQGAPRLVRTDDGRTARATRWLVRFAIPLAAIVGVVVLTPLFRRESGPVMRGNGEPPRLLEPAGDVTEFPTRFTWTRDTGAARYRFELYDDRAVKLYESVTEDTTIHVPVKAWLITVPPAGRPSRAVPGGSWRVVPIDGPGFERPPSATAAFQVVELPGHPYARPR